jgi:hypothetical protein
MHDRSSIKAATSDHSGTHDDMRKSQASKDPAAVALGRLGGKKGGKACAAKLTGRPTVRDCKTSSGGTMGVERKLGVMEETSTIRYILVPLRDVALRREFLRAACSAD